MEKRTSEKLIKDLVSICIPVYNHEKTLRETILSALYQSYRNIEIIIVDDCSEDQSMSIAYSFEDSRIRIYKNETNVGMVNNWNKALCYARGEYAILLHGDDRLYVTSVEKKIALMKMRKDVVIAFSASNVINGENEILMERHPFRKKMIMDGRKLAKYSYLTKNIYGEPGNIMFRTAMARELGGFAKNTIYATDWDLWLRISCYGRVAYTNEVLMDYRITRTNVTSKTRFLEMLKDDEVFTNNIKKYGLLDIKLMDTFVHRFVILQRTLIRNMFLRYKI